MIYYCITAGVFLLLHVMWGWACPEDVHREIFICMSNLTTGIHEDGRRLGEDAYIYRRICRTKEFLKAITCVKSLFYQCRHQQDNLDLLKKLADTDNINKAFKMMCDNMNLYEESSKCLLTQNGDITACIHYLEKAFDKESNASYSVDQQIHAYCGFQTGFRNCVVVPVKRECGEPIGNLLADFMKGVTAPACHSAASLNRFSGFVVSVLLLPVIFSYVGYQLTYT